MVHFRRRIGICGIEKIFKISIELHGKHSLEKEVVIDTTVQEKNITNPTDVKLHKKIIDKCVKLATTDGRQSCKRISKQLVIDQRGNRSKKGKAKAKIYVKKLKTIAGRLTRELRRKSPKETLENYEEEIRLFEKVLEQTKMLTGKEPKVAIVDSGYRGVSKVGQTRNNKTKATKEECNSL